MDGAASRKSGFSEEQIVQTLREADPKPVAEVAKRHAVSQRTIHAWRKRFGQMGGEDVKRLPVVDRLAARAT